VNTPEPGHDPGLDGHDPEPPAKSGHDWMMIACCIPMLVIVGILVATGVAGAGLILAAVMCTAMMWMMMRAM
jgi:hypothetical protein